MSTTDQPTITNVADDISTALESTDAQTASRLQTLSLVHQARIAQLTRTAATVTAQYGAESPEATAAQAAVTASQAVAARSEIVSRQLGTALPTVPAGGWVLHGRVYDAQAEAVATQTVFLVDPQGAFQSEYGFAYTDETGYFLLTFDAPTPSPAEGGASAAASTPELYVEVTNQKRQPVYLSATPFEPTKGTATYLNIYLPAGGQPIGEPPPGARSSALPLAPKAGKRTAPKSRARRSGTK
jgi:hypothetical protein